MTAERGLDAVDVCRRLTEACRAAGGQAKWAQANGVSPQFLSDILHARNEPNRAVLAALGLRRVVRYVECRTAPAPEAAP